MRWRTVLGRSSPAVGKGRLSVPHSDLLPEAVPEASRAMILDVALSVAVKAPALFHGARAQGRTSALQGGDKAGVPRRRSLQPSWAVGGQVHEDKRGLLVGSRKCRGVGGRLSPADVVLDLAVVQGRDEPLDEEDVVPGGSIQVREVEEDPHSSVQLLDGFVRELHHTSKLGSQQLRVALWKETALILFQHLLGSFRPGEGDVHYRFEGSALHVRVHELF